MSNYTLEPDTRTAPEHYHVLGATLSITADAETTDGEAFECLKCGCENHADYNAAKNIGLRYLRRNQTGGDGGAPLGVRLNNGTLNVHGGYSPAEESARTGVNAESHR